MNYFTPEKIEIRHFRLFEKSRILYIAMAEKTLSKWPKVVSEVIFPRFWGVVCVEKCFRIFVSMIGSAVSEKWRFARFYVSKCCSSTSPGKKSSSGKQLTSRVELPLARVKEIRWKRCLVVSPSS